MFECKSFGARLGNADKYSEYADVVVVVSPEKLYRPKAENLYIVRVEAGFDNSDLRKKLRPFVERAIGL